MSRLMPREVNEEQTKRIQDLNVAIESTTCALKEEKEKSPCNGLKKLLCGQIKQSLMREQTNELE